MPELKESRVDEIRDTVRERYGSIARSVTDGDTSVKASCCGGSSGCCGTTETWDPISTDLYEEGQTAGLPVAALLASLGCGNPTALAELHEGEVVLDLGSGGGIDVLLSAKRVGPTGKAYGVDMTDEMLALAVENREKAGATNVEFLKGHIEAIPLPSNTVDVIISNCVINLAPNKEAVFREAYRVLAPGGRLAISDVVATGDVPAAVAADPAAYTGCIAGAAPVAELERTIAAAGFTEVRVAVQPSSRALMESWSPGTGELVASAVIEAVKPR
jgi:arsenite methyltransferase